jgi:hypothetical protein
MTARTIRGKTFFLAKGLAMQALFVLIGGSVMAVGTIDRTQFIIVRNIIRVGICMTRRTAILSMDRTVETFHIHKEGYFSPVLLHYKITLAMALETDLISGAKTGRKEKYSC